MINHRSPRVLAFSALMAVTLVLTSAPVVSQAQTAAATAAATQTAYPPTLAPDQKVSINFYSYNLSSAGIGADGTNQLISEFEALHPNITVQGVPVAVTALMTRNQADVAAGNPPDVSQLGFPSLDFVAHNFPVHPLEDIVSPAELAQYWTGFSPNGKALGELEGKTYAVPYTFSTPILFYNADIFKAAGLDPEKPPTTWAEVKTDALQINQKTGNGGVFIAGFGPSQGDWMFQGLVASNGGGVLSADRKTLTFADASAVGVVSMWQDLVKSGAHPNLDATEGYTAFSAGKIGMMLQTSAVQGAMLAASQGKWTLRAAKMPAFGTLPTKPSNSGSALFIMAATPEKQRAAWEFVKFVTSERGYTIITSKIGYLPLRPAIVDDPQYLQGWVKDHPLVQPNLEQLKNLRGTVPFPGANYQQIINTMMQAVQAAVFSTGDPQTIMSQAQTQAQSLMP